MSVASANVFHFSDNTRGKDPLDDLTEESNSDTAIIIDNGSYECRAGYRTSKEPDLIFRNLALRQKGRNGEGDSCSVGHDIENFEAVRLQLRSPFDRNVVTQFDAQEMVFDYIFSKLSVSSEEKVSSPVVISEPVVNPNHCRKYMSELLFECYNVPTVTYYTDSMASWHTHTMRTDLPSDYGIVVSIGYGATHVIPIVNGKMDANKIRRISVGGYHLDYFMQRLLQLKYPIHSTSITLTRAEELSRNHTHLRLDYGEGCNDWLDIPYYEKMVHRIQLPYNNVPTNFAATALAGERQVERAKLAKEKQALEKLEEKKNIYDQLIGIGELTGTKLYRRLAELGVDSLGELQCHIKAVQATVEDMKRKLVHKDLYNAGELTVKWIQDKIDILDNPDSITAADIASFDVAEYYQLHVGLEQIRVPELLFQPSMIGIDQTGISETLNFVITRYDEATQLKLAKNIYLRGGCASLPGIVERVHADMQTLRPFQSELNVTKASDSVLDAWLGAKNWLGETDRTGCAITQAVYNELGGEYLLEHDIGNRYFKTPDSK